MSETPPPRSVVPQDQRGIQFKLSDITASPVHKTLSPRTQSVDAKLRRKWKRQIEREKAYEREKAQRSKDQGVKQPEKKSSNLIADLLVPCVADPCADRARLEQSYEHPLPESAYQNLSNSLIVADEPPPAVVTPDEKPSGQPETVPDASKVEQLYSPKEPEDSFLGRSQLYAPQEQDYLKFLQDLEQESVDPSVQQKDFADWLQKKVDKDLHPIPTEARAQKRVAFSKETTVRFFSRTREELLQLRRRYKRTINPGEAVDDDSSDEEEWPLFRYLDEKLKELEESKAWDDPMAAVTDMFVPKDVKDKITNLCVCESQAASANVNDTSVNNSLADLDDEELEPAMALAASRAAAALQMDDEKDSSSQSPDSNASGHPALWFAVPYKTMSGASEEHTDFIHPVMSSTSSAGTDKTKKASTRDKASSPVLAVAPKSLSLIKESGSTTEDPDTKSMVKADPDAPKKSNVSWIADESITEDPSAPKELSLSWLADELDDSREENGKRLLWTDSSSSPKPFNDKNISIGSLGRNTNSKLLRQVSEHLNLSSIVGSSGGRGDNSTMPQDESMLSNSTHNTTTSSMELESATALKELFEKSDATSDKQSISVALAEIDKLVRLKETNLSNSSQEPKISTAKEPATDDTKAAPLNDDADSSSSKETPFDQRRAYRRRQVETVKAAKRWAASQKVSANPSPEKRRATRQKSSSEQGPDLDESRNCNVVNHAIDGVANNSSSNVWEGINDSAEEARNNSTEEARKEGHHSPRKEQKSMDSTEWFAAEAGPDLDESKAWHEFTYEEPDMTNTTGSASHDEVEEWMPFSSEKNQTNSSLTEQAWAETSFPADEDLPKTKPTRIASKKQGPSPSQSPRKLIRAASARSTRVKALASQLEYAHCRKSVSERHLGVSPLTPAIPWVDDSQRNKEYVEEYPDLQQPVLDESRSDPNRSRSSSGSNKSSPVSVTHL